MVNQNSINQASPFNGESYNTFNRGNFRLQTERFADVAPFLVGEGIEGDNVRIRPTYRLDTYTMKSRFLSPMQKNLDVFQVPLSAMMPRSWKALYRNPNKGLDVPDDAYPLFDIKTFIDRQQNLLDYHMTEAGDHLSGTTRSTLLAFEDLFMNVLHTQMLAVVASNGSLLKHLQYSVPGAEEVDKAYAGALKIFVDLCQLIKPSITFSDLNGVSRVYTYADTFDTVAHAFNFFDDFSRGLITIAAGASPYLGVTFGVQLSSSTDTEGAAIHSEMADVNGYTYNWVTNVIDVIQPEPINLCRVIAYRSVIAQYFTNPNVDDIYSSDMWQQNHMGFAHTITAITFGASDIQFSLNGSVYQYDVFSKKYNDVYLINDNDPTNYPNTNYQMAMYWLFMDTFQFGSSLRYGDYFASSRLTPLAVGDVTAAVNANAVSAVDMNTATWMQRFLNAVNRSVQDIYTYMQDMTGIKPERISPQPNFCIHESFSIRGNEVENTAGTNPDSGVTTMLESRSGFEYTVFFDEPSVILGVSSYTAPFVYPAAVDRNFDLSNRFDWFNSFLQHIGDQDVKSHELDVNAALYTSVFGYQLRYAEFKFGVSHAVGAFASGYLPPMAMIWNQKKNDSVLSANFIRNHNEDLDEFYSSLSAVNYADRFHFICSYDNSCSANSKQQAFPSLM